jgi:hypothetical protein
MADYKNIKGFNIQYLDSDPPNPIEGQMWFNSTTQTLKGEEAGGLPAGTWASGGNLNTARGYLAGAGASADDALAVSGEPTGGSNTGATEVYNGTSWTNTTSVNSARRGLGGAGTVSTAVLVFAGYTTGSSALTELWNGSTWTEVNDLNTARYAIYGSGTSISAITDVSSTSRILEWNKLDKCNSL